jgi:hypothetical protein
MSEKKECVVLTCSRILTEDDIFFTLDGKDYGFCEECVIDEVIHKHVLKYIANNCIRSMQKGGAEDMLRFVLESASIGV